MLFFSDHGMRLWRHKQFLYDSGTRVPFIVAYSSKDGRVESGTINNDLISGLDIGRESLGLADAAPLDYTESRNFLSPDYIERNYVISARDRCDFTFDKIQGGILLPPFTPPCMLSHSVVFFNFLIFRDLLKDCTVQLK